ncbi:MAG: hypothetical protein ACP5R5_08785 [Armatimonadota bacterium]
MGVVSNLPSSVQTASGSALTGASVCRLVGSALIDAGLWLDGKGRKHLVSPEPFPLGPDQVTKLRDLGAALLEFYRAANALYLRGEPEWAAEYLDIGKPDDLRRHARMNYQKRALPRVIRPDILITEHGFAITELDSVPGGIGHLDCLSAAYESAGFELVGSPRGMLEGFRSILREAAGRDDPVCAIVVSDESEDYRPEMSYLADQLRHTGLEAHAVHPRQVRFTEEGLFVDGAQRRVDVVYRFFELFDLPNIPKAELIAYAAKKRLAVVTPPYKHHLEEKLLLALLHSAPLREYWIRAMCAKNYELLLQTVSPTWIMDSRPVPPHAEISGFRYRGGPIRDWREIRDATQKERRLVIKPSGFSALAWGSRGVRIGHDMPQQEWSRAVDDALASFGSSPYVIQPFREAAVVGVEFWDETRDSAAAMEARVRLCPYYFVIDERAELAGVLATACSKEKKLIHGMSDAVMMPCREASSCQQEELLR